MKLDTMRVPVGEVHWWRRPDELREVYVKMADGAWYPVPVVGEVGVTLPKGVTEMMWSGTGWSVPL
jgi:hypothetical protein